MSIQQRVTRPDGLALGVMFAAGAALALLVPFVPHGREIQTVGWMVNASLALPIAGVLIVAPHRIPDRAYHLLLVVGGVVVANGIWFGNGGAASVAAAFFYIWVPLYAFWAWEWRAATAHVVGDAALLGTALAATGVPGGQAVWMIIVGTAAVAGLVVGLMRRQLTALATLDPLTQLPNRYALEDALTREIARVRRHPAPLAVAVLDVDDLKVVNDRDGHQAGDECLRAAAAAWRAALRETDLLVRIGGDEFVAVMPRTSAADAHRILARLEATSPTRFSAGVVACEATDDAESVIARADALLYEAKRSGGRRVATVPSAALLPTIA